MGHRFSEPLTSARLQLRRLRRDDADMLCAYRSLPEVARYQSWESFDRGDAERLIEAQLEAEPGVAGTWFQAAIVEAADGRMIGDCGLHCRKDDPRQFEIGITLSPAAQGRGMAAEALECLLHYVFESLAAHRVVASVDVLNHSAAALFLRSGFRQEAHFVESLWFKGSWGSEYLFAMLKHEWEERRST